MRYFIYGLGLLFIGLKLTGYIDWSWWFVTSPILLILVVSTIAAVVAACEELKKDRLREEYFNRHPLKKSKFMERLEEAMKKNENSK